MNPKNLIAALFVLFISFFIFFSCSKKDEIPVETCFDKIKNQNETDVDCGGTCKPCPQSMTAKVNGNSWEADTASIAASYSSTGSKFLLKGNAAGFYPQISLVYLEAFSTGEHTLDHSSSFTPSFSGFATFISSGTLTISELDTRNRLISGSFHFTSNDASSTYNVTEGTFINVRYKMN
jgi:uncharacterized protein DUF6252